MPRKKIVKEPIEKVKDEQVVLEIIEDSSDEEALPPPPEDNAIRVSKGHEVISQMTTEDIKEELTPKPRKKRVLSEEQKAKMKAGREKKKAQKALEAGKEQKRPAPIITTNLEPPPVETPPLVVNTDEPPRWFKAYMATQKKVEPEPVKEATAPAKKGRGRPAGKKDSKPRAKPKKQSTVEPEEVILPPPKTSMRFI